MKRMSRYTRTGKLLVLLLCALLLVSTLPAFGARNTGNAKKKNKGTGSVTVSLSTAHTKLPSNAKVEFTLYKIGDPAPDDPAGWKFDSGLAKYEKNIISAGKLSDDKTQEAVNELAKKIPGSYKVETKALSNGSATFDDLADGVYLGVLSKAPTGMTANASLFTIPVKNDTTGQLSYSRDITVKDEYTAPTPTPTVTPTTTPPDDDTPPGGGVPDVTPEPTTEISGTKVWADNGNAENTRPGSIQITLLADGTPVNAAPSWSKSGDRWTFKFSGLPKFNSSGSEIEYTVEETPVDNYTSSVDGLTITNELNPPKVTGYTDISGQKTWNDNDNKNGKRPTTITVRLLRDGVEVESRIVTAGTNWEYTFQHLPLDNGYGHTYIYKVQEDGVPGYFNRVDGYNITNTPISIVPPPTGGTTPNVPTVPTVPQDVPERHTGTPIPQFEELTDEELEELFDMFGYGTPLYGMLGTGDQVPVWVWICGGVGVLAVILFLITGKKKKNAR